MITSCKAKDISDVLSLMLDNEVSAHGVLQEFWYNIPSPMLASLLADRRFPNSPDVVSILENFDAPVDIHSNYGQRLTAYLQVLYITNFTHFIAFNDLLHTVNPQRKPKTSTNSILVTSKLGSMEFYQHKYSTKVISNKKLNFG